MVTEHHAALARQAGSGAAEGGASDAGKLDIAAEIKAEFDGMQVSDGEESAECVLSPCTPADLAPLVLP